MSGSRMSSVTATGAISRTILTTGPPRMTTTPLRPRAWTFSSSTLAKVASFSTISTGWSVLPQCEVVVFDRFLRRHQPGQRGNRHGVAGGRLVRRARAAPAPRESLRPLPPAAMACISLQRIAGRKSVNVLPTPAWLSSVRSPPSNCAMSRLIDNPNPVPP